MPFVEIKIFEGHSLERKRKIAAEVTTAIASTAEISEDLVQIVFQDVSKSDWGAGGKICSDFM